MGQGVKAVFLQRLTRLLLTGRIFLVKRMGLKFLCKRIRVSRAVYLLACAALLVLSADNADAQQFLPTVGYAASGGGAAVMVNNQPAIKFRVSNGGLSPMARAEITASRLKQLIYGDWRMLTVKTLDKHRAQVAAGNQLICIATQADAKAAGTSAAALAGIWVNRLKELFAMPPVEVKPSRLTVPEGERRFAQIGGVIAGPAEVESKDPSVATAVYDPIKKAVAVMGLRIGTCRVMVNKQGFTAELTVEVKRYAARIARAAIAEVTGNPAPAAIVRDAAADAASAAVVLEPGASAEYGEPTMPEGNLPLGSKIRVIVPVKAAGENLLPIELAVPVDVVNRRLPQVPTKSLLYSNEPERISRFGMLFSACLGMDERQRLFFHHINVIGKPLRLRVEVLNAGQTDAQVHSVIGTSEPRVDPVDAGYRAGIIFIRDFLVDAGRVYNLPPRSRLALYVQTLDHLKTASGICDLRVLQGEGVYVRVLAEPVNQVGPKVGQTAPILDGDIPTSLSAHIYESPAKLVEAKYVVGERWQFIRIGKFAITNNSGDRHLYGNYGVVYEIKITVENPTPTAKAIQIDFEPTAGAASGIFIIDGKFLSVKAVVPPREFNIAKLKVEAGQTRHITIKTMPTGGSAYPATIVVRS